MLFIRNFILSAILISTSAAYAETSMRIGTNVWPGYEPFYIAQDIENWQDSSQYHLVQYPSATEVLKGFRNHSIDAAALTLDEALLLVESKLPIKVILVTDISHGGDVIMASSDIKTFQDIKGKRVGVEGGALGAYVLTRALEVNNLSLDDIQIVLKDFDAHELAFKSREIDAVVTFEPTRTRLINLGAHEIFTSKEIPNEVVDVVVVHEDFLQSNPERVKGLIKSWFKALNYLKEEPKAASEIISKRLKITPEEVLGSFDGLILPNAQQNRTLLGGSKPTLNKTLRLMQKTMLEQSLLLSPVETENLLSPNYLPQTQ